MVLTTDPSQRLRTALGLADGTPNRECRWNDPKAGELWAALLDVRATLDRSCGGLYAKRK